MSSSKDSSRKGQGMWWWFSAGIVFIVAILAVIIFVNPAPKSPATAADPTMATATTKAPVGGCNVPAGDTSSKPAMPKDLRWAAAKGWTWPVSDTYGPTQKKDGYGICFARSPLGAALMAVTFNSVGNTGNPKMAIEQYVASSPGKDVALAAATSQAVGRTPIAYAGFIVDSYTPDETQITIVAATDKSTTGYLGTPETFRWIDGDWKLKVLDSGEVSAGQPVTPVAGQFVMWRDLRG